MGNFKDGIAMYFHENTKEINGNNSFDINSQYKVYPNTENLRFKNAMELFNGVESDFIDILLKRKSVRNFEKTSINFDVLTKLLTLSFGVNGRKEKHIEFRTYPSAGGRYPIEVYLVIVNSQDIDLGIYHYNIIDNSLELVKKGNYYKEMQYFYANQKLYISNAPIYLMFSMVFERTIKKYAERGYRFILLDAGHMSQNLYLVSQYLKLGTVALGAGDLNDEFIEKLLGINKNEESFFYGFALGIPSEYSE